MWLNGQASTHNAPCWISPPSIECWPAACAWNGPHTCLGRVTKPGPGCCPRFAGTTKSSLMGCRYWYPSDIPDDVRPTAEVGGLSRLVGLGEWLPPGTLWMVLCRWLTSTGSLNACAVPLSLQGSSPITPGPVLGHMCGTVRLVYTKKLTRRDPN